MGKILLLFFIFALCIIDKGKGSIIVSDKSKIKKTKNKQKDISSSTKELLNTYRLYSNDNVNFSKNVFNKKLTKINLPNCSRPAPPRGWNSFDSKPFPDLTINESQLLNEAKLIASLNPGAGLKYIVIDEGWADQAHPQRWFLDQYGRQVADTQLFPSAAPDGSLAKLVKLIKSKYGLQLGVWIMKGITKQAVDKKLPIYGTNYTADQIALPSTCPWHTDVFNINMSHPGGQAYYDSIAKLYVQEWGLKYIKIDCIFGNNLRKGEVVGFIKAVEKYDISNDVVTSLSPGGTIEEEVLHIGQNADMYRITSDLHDCWTFSSCKFGSNFVSDGFKLIRISKFLDGSRNDYVTSNRGSWPDMDMLPLGEISVSGGKRWSRVTTPSKSRYIYGLWSITRSPIILGGSMKSVVNTDYLKSMIDNPSLLTVSECSANPKILDYQYGLVDGWLVWSVRHGALPNVIYVGFFAYGWIFNTTISIPWHKIINMFDIKMPSTGNLKIFDVFEQKSHNSVNYSSFGSFSISVPVNDAIIYSFIAN